LRCLAAVIWRSSSVRRSRSGPAPNSADPGVDAVAYSFHGDYLAAGNANGTILADPADAAVRSVVFTTDNRALAGGDSAGNVFVWQVRSRQLTESLTDPDNTSGVESVAFNSSTTTIATADGNGCVYLWLYKDKPVGTLQDRDKNGALSVAYSPDNTHLAVAYANGNVRVGLMS
jgi:WD40 repeat protein